MDTSRIALQLYSVRDALAQDFAGTLRRVAEMGYSAVETAFLPDGVTLADAAARLRAHGLKPISAHVDLPLGDARDGVLRIAEAYGVTRIVWHGWPEDPRYSTLDGLRSLADDYSAACAFAKSQGLSLGLHNHWWEMRPVGDMLPYRYMMQHAAAELFFELDAYWTRVAGLDPLAVAREMGARLPLLHIKDGPAVRHQPMSALGTGVMDIPALLGACDANVEYVIVELDECATDMLEAVAASWRYLVSV
jgi:sugar phosphate isomerase/epimerase